MAPIWSAGWLSVVGVQVLPPFVVFQTPRDTVAAQ
jgi:hypothetical protein